MEENIKYIEKEDMKMWTELNKILQPYNLAAWQDGTELAPDGFQ
jgi:hypothetical protein